MKRCPKCDAEKLLSEFTPDKHKASGYSSWCKPCVAARSKDYYKRTGGTKAKARYQGNRERLIAQSVAAAKARYRADPDKARQRWRDEWRKRSRTPNHRERKRASYMKRHGGIDEWARMFADQDGLCYLCQEPLPEDGRDVHVDHDHSCCAVGPRESRSCQYCRRGLTHQACNQIWGLARENPALLRVLADNGERVGAETRLRIAVKPVTQDVLSTEAQTATEEAVSASDSMPSLEMPEGVPWPPAAGSGGALLTHSDTIPALSLRKSPAK